MKKYIFCSILVFTIMIAGYIQLFYAQKQFQRVHLNYVGSSAMKTEVLNIYTYLKANHYIDLFGYLNSQYRFDRKKQVELLHSLHDKNFFNRSGISKDEPVKFSPFEYVNCLQTLIVLCGLLDSCITLGMPEGGNTEKMQFLQCRLAVWVLNFPHGDFTGRENILKRSCAENLRKITTVPKKK